MRRELQEALECLLATQAASEQRIIARINEAEVNIRAGLTTVAGLVLNEGTRIMADLSRLTEEVSENTEVVASAVTLLNQLAELLREAATDPEAVNALADQLDSSSGALAAAVAANTPADPPVDDGEPDA